MTSILDCLNTTPPIHYIALNPEPVEQFLARHPDVTQVLLEATKPIQEVFGKNAQVSLAVTRDPDIADEEFLVSSIQTSLSAQQASTRLSRFDDLWWLENAPRVEGQLMFTVAFK
jgi:hypothetical protein